MKILTTVEIPKSGTLIDYSSRILTLGSCFADQMGERMGMYGFDCMVNPFGTLYNICSVYNSLMRLGAVAGLLRSQDNPLFSKQDVFLRPDGRFVTWSLFISHSSTQANQKLRIVSSEIFFHHFTV